MQTKNDPIRVVCTSVTSNKFILQRFRRVCLPRGVLSGKGAEVSSGGCYILNPEGVAVVQVADDSAGPLDHVIEKRKHPWQLVDATVELIKIATCCPDHPWRTPSTVDEVGSASIDHVVQIIEYDLKLCMRHLELSLVHQSAKRHHTVT